MCVISGYGCKTSLRFRRRGWYGCGCDGGGMALSLRIQGVTAYKDDSATVSYMYGDSPVSLSIPYTALSGMMEGMISFIP